MLVKSRLIEYNCATQLIEVWNDQDQFKRNWDYDPDLDPTKHSEASVERVSNICARVCIDIEDSVPDGQNQKQLFHAFVAAFTLGYLRK